MEEARRPSDLRVLTDALDHASRFKPIMVL